MAVGRFQTSRCIWPQVPANDDFEEDLDLVDSTKACFRATKCLSRAVQVGASVVKIFVTRQRPALVVPWQSGG